MGWLILAAIVAVPMIEIGVFIKVASAIGLVPTIATAVLAGVAGIALLRRQGLSTVSSMQAAMQRGEMPVREAFDGICLLVAGALLLLPGLVSDVFALLLLLPPVRAALRAWLGRHLLRSGQTVGGGERRTVVIDADFHVVDDKSRDR